MYMYVPLDVRHLTAHTEGSVLLNLGLLKNTAVRGSFSVSLY